MLTLQVVEDLSALATHVPAWEDLAADAAEPNPFHEPWMLLPALDAFGAGAALRFVLAYAAPHPQGRGEAPLLCGFFPLEQRPRYRGLPVRHLGLWRYKHGFLGTPLVRRGYTEQCMLALSDWLATDPRGASAMEWREITADGRFFAALSGAGEARGTGAFRPYERSRALLCRMRDAETYLEHALPKSSRKEFRRLERRLGDLGPVAYRSLEKPADAPAWIERFLALEATGWKGERGSALASAPASREFFTRAALAAAQRGRLMMLALEVGGRAIAMKCNLLAREGAFAFKIAYDEAFARYSPGTLLELENIRAFHRMPALQWMDSCAAPGHFMANRLWLDRRPLIDLVAATRPGNPLIALLSLLHRLRRGRRRASAPTPVTP
jgi:CelD/BcsL family acetyltransferase involved in cellulose biosynthesis